MVGTAVVLFWRGMWGLMDMWLFPNNELLSYLTSAMVGVAILVATHKLDDELS